MSIFSKIIVVSFILAGMITAVAFGGDPAASLAVASSAPVTNSLSAMLQATNFPVLSAFLMGVVTIFLTKLGNKFGVDALTQKNNILERLAFQGVTLAEEKAAQYVGSKSALTGNQKIDIAIGHILSFAPKISPTQAQSLVESTLARIGGAGATGSTVYSLSPASVILPAVVAPDQPDA